MLLMNVGLEMVAVCMHMCACVFHSWIFLSSLSLELVWLQ